MNRRWSFKSSFALVLAAAILVLTGCGDSGASEDEIREAREAGAKQAREQQKIQQIQKELKALRKKNGAEQTGSSGGGVSPAPDSSVATSGNCGGDLSANENTTCGFAVNVRNAYYSEIGSGSGSVVAWSPTTAQYYEMYCTAGSPHECTGGNNAGVYFP